MKTMKLLPLSVIVFFLSYQPVTAQNQSGVDSTGLPGDNFSLQGALQLFKDAASVEDFETALNTEGNHVNNLDLNGDGQTDYVSVIDKTEKDAHAFILRALVSPTESQDIAVIELEKTGPENAVIQIVGDEDIYGEEVIVEPGDDSDDNAVSDMFTSTSSGPSPSFTKENAPIVINVWIWPSVRFVFGPVYHPWISPWRWSYYPGWWKPWRPVGWVVWHPFIRPFHHHFVVAPLHRAVVAHRIYTPFRTTSVTVRTRHATVVGNYRVTRTKTRVTGPRGHTTTVRKTTVTGPRGGKATKVRVRRH
ncbi:MAG: hypothetical protein U0U70_10385 [Chitinophagaceae bacterium]